MNNYIKKGDNMTLVAPSGGVTSGLGYVIGAIFCVSEDTIAAASDFVGVLEGVFQFTKDTGDTASQGAKVWWDNTNKKVEFASATGLYEIGTLMSAATSGPLTAKVRLNGIAVTAVPGS